MVSDAERTLIDNLFQRGPAALLDVGMSTDQIRKFMARPDVTEEMDALTNEMKFEVPLQHRARFMALRRLGRMMPQSLSVLQEALDGPTYRRDNQGVIERDERGHLLLIDAGPSGQQVAVAFDNLDRLGVHKTARHERLATNINLSVLFGAEVKQVRMDVNLKTPEQRALSRERMRNALEQMTPKLLGLRKKLAGAAALQNRKPTHAVRRKKSSHKAGSS